MPRAPVTPFEESVYRPIIHQIPLRGVAPDKPIEELGNEFLATASNFLVRDGRVQKRSGYSLFPTAAAATTGFPMALWEFISTRTSASISALMLLATTSDFYSLTPSAANWTSLTATARTGTTDNPIFFCSVISASAGQQIISVNGVDPPYSWAGDPAFNFRYLNTAIIGACVAPWKNHVLMGDTNEATGDGAIVTRIHWSALGDPATWTGTASAGSIDLTEANASRVMNLVPMRSTLVAYKEEGVHALAYRSSPLWFTQGLLHPLVSSISRRCMTPVRGGEQHFVLTKDGAILWDGQYIQPIGRDRVDRTILRTLNWNARHTIWTAWWAPNEEVLLGMPTGTSTTPDTVWIYNLNHDAWWQQSLPWRAAGPAYFQGSAPMLLVGGAGTNLNKAFRGFTGGSDATAGTAIAATLQTGFFDYGVLEHKQIYKLGVLAAPMVVEDTGTVASGSITFDITKASQENPLAAATFTSAQTLTIDAGELQLRHIDFLLTDRWVSYRVNVTAQTTLLTIKALIPYVTERTGRNKRS